MHIHLYNKIVFNFFIRFLDKIHKYQAIPIFFCEKFTNFITEFQSKFSSNNPVICSFPMRFSRRSQINTPQKMISKMIKNRFISRGNNYLSTIFNGIGFFYKKKASVSINISSQIG